MRVVASLPLPVPIDAEKLDVDRSGSVYSTGEAQLNTLGYKLLQHDSLGEAYLRKGDRANALANYTRALALEPQNVGAMEVLRWLKT